MIGKLIFLIYINCLFMILLLTPENILFLSPNIASAFFAIIFMKRAYELEQEIYLGVKFGVENNSHRKARGSKTL